MKRMLANGNIELTVALLPEAYAALTAAMERDGMTEVDAVNVAVMSLEVISKLATAAGTPLNEAPE
jgi:hypothetical protein